MLASRIHHAIPAARRGQTQTVAKTKKLPVARTARATTAPRVCLGDAVRVSARLPHLGLHAYRYRGGLYLDASRRANGARARTRRHTVNATGSFSEEPQKEPSSTNNLESRPGGSTTGNHSHKSHKLRRLMLALCVFALVTLVVVEGCTSSVSSAFSSSASKSKLLQTMQTTVPPDGLMGLMPPDLPRHTTFDCHKLLKNVKPIATIALMSFLSITPVPLRRVSRITFNALALLLAANGAPAWTTAAVALSGPYVGRAVRLCITWALANHLVRNPAIFDPSIVLSVPPVAQELFGTLSSVFGSGLHKSSFDLHDLTIRETQGWFFVTSTRSLAAGLSMLCAKWVMHAKRPPPKPTEVVSNGNGNTTGDEQQMTSEETKEHLEKHVDPVARHFAALRGDDGVSWDRQARSVLVDSALSLLVTIASVLAVANALRVNITGLLAVGGFSGVAFGFAAQRCVANFISGLLIFVTQPFKKNDLIATAHGTGEGAFRGVVRQVGWHSTSLESAKDGSVLIVPNSELSTVPVKNLSRTERRNVLETVPVNLIEGDGGNSVHKIRAAVFAANKVLRTHPGVMCYASGHGVDAKKEDTSVDGAGTPRCVLESNPTTGAAHIKCAYVMRPTVPEHSAEAVRSGVLVKLREDVARALNEPKDLEINVIAYRDESESESTLREIVEADFPDVARTVAESMRRGERRYEDAEGRYRDINGAKATDNTNRDDHVDTVA